MALPDTDRSAQCHARDARARVLAALAAGRQWVAVVDPAGFDKTAVLRDAERALAAEATATMRIATEPGQPSALLVETGEHGTAFVDNAERLSGATLARFAGTGMLQCVFAGPPELVGKLMDHVAGTELMMLGHAPVDPDGIAASTGPEREGGLPDVAAVPQPTAPPGHGLPAAASGSTSASPRSALPPCRRHWPSSCRSGLRQVEHPMTPVSPLPWAGPRRSQDDAWSGIGRGLHRRRRTDSALRHRRWRGELSSIGAPRDAGPSGNDRRAASDGSHASVGFALVH